MEERTFNPETDNYPLPEVDEECYAPDSVELEEVTTQKHRKEE